MKGLYRNMLPTLIVFIIIAIASCSKFEDIIEDVPVYIDTDIVANALTIQFLDARSGTDARPEDIDITISGKDKDEIYSLLGERKLRVTDGILKIGIRKIHLPDPTTPLEFTLHASAPGYMDITRNIVITDEQPVFTYINMVNEQNPPQGISMDKGRTVEMKDGALARALTVSQSPSDGQVKAIHFLIPESTRFLDQNGQMLHGTPSLDIVNFDAIAEKEGTYFPGGYAAEALDENAEPLGKRYFNPVSFGQFHVNVAGQKAQRISTTGVLNLTLNEQLTYPGTERPIQSGDILELWGYNKAQNIWQRMEQSEIQSINGALSVSMAFNTLPDYWAVTFVNPVIGGVQLFVTSAVNRDDPEVFYYVVLRQLTAGRTNINAQTIWEGYARMFNGQTFFFADLPPRGIGIAEVYNAKHECNDKKLLTRSFFFWEPYGPDFDIRNYSKSGLWLNPKDINNRGRFPITIDVFGVCANGDTVLRGVPTIDIQYSMTDCRDFELLGRLRSGKGNTGALKKGKRYNFYFVHADLFRTLFDFPITTQDTTYRIQSPVYNYFEDVDVEYNEIDDRIDFKWYNVAIPRKACEEYRQYY